MRDQWEEKRAKLENRVAGGELLALRALGGVGFWFAFVHLFCCAFSEMIFASLFPQYLKMSVFI